MRLDEQRIQSLPETLQRAATLPLHDGMYAEASQRGLDLTGYLECLDPSPEAAPLDAFERQLAVAGIRVNGDDADVIDRFFATSESAVLFPEFVSRSVRTGAQDFTKLKKLLANRVRVDDGAYKTLYMDESVMDAKGKSLAKVAEGASLPKIELRTAEHTVRLAKYGRYLQATYEAIRRKRAPVVSLFLRSIGVQIQRDKFEEAIAALLLGDGNANPAEEIQTATSGTLTYADLIQFALSFDPYELNALVCNANTAAILLNLDEVKEPTVSNRFMVKGESLRLFGAELLVDEAAPDDVIIGLDRRFALQEVYETGVLIESDRLIRRQIEGTAITETAGFAKVIAAASKALQISWD